MDIEALIARVREHYIDQFRTFVSGQKQKYIGGASELKLRVRSDGQIFQQLYCVDFIKNDPVEIFEFRPERVLSFQLVTGTIGEARLHIEHLQWDNVLIYHDAGGPLMGLENWFVRWFDEKDERSEPTSEFSYAIHSLGVETDRLSIDFGSAPTLAFWELLSLIEGGGAKAIRVTNSQANADGGMAAHLGTTPIASA